MRRVLALLASAVVLGGLLNGCGESPAREPLRFQRYVALGDSFTAAPFVPVTRTYNGCRRSNHNYPRLLTLVHAKVEEFADASCGGATTSHLVTRQLPATPPQMDYVTAETDLITIGLGINNGGLYRQLVGPCIAATCDLTGRAAELDRILTQMRANLVDALALVTQRAPDARVVLIGYPDLVPDELPARGTCPDFPQMTREDLAVMNSLMERVRDEMRAAADYSNVGFLDVWAASDGHDICSRAPWVRGRTTDTRIAAAMHPYPLGQTQVAELLAAHLRAA